MKRPDFKNSALIIIDIQNDFCPGGALAVPDGDSIISTINSLCSQFRLVIAAQDWHPVKHISFASTHPGKQVYDTIPWNNDTQILWPDHCIAGSPGSAFHPALNTDLCSLIIRKGINLEIDSYSAFFENDHITPTGLAGYLEEQKITSLVLCGLATDYCIYYSALDAVKLGFSVSVLQEGVRGVNQPEGSIEAAISDMQQKGIEFI
ncbi:MAG: bifunctional nicotinamidase/pyrazinamidase [Spirochaetia bacterium]|nr:bifunctional nicotinamidase/pyrazinamidase [Spirochaetia bacterium]